MQKMQTTAIAVALSLCVAATASAQPAPSQVIESDLTVQLEHVATMPFVTNPPPPLPGAHGNNLASPVAIGNKLYLIDQADGIYRLNGKKKVQKIFGRSEAPDGLVLDETEAIVNISEGSRANRVYVMFTSANAPTTGIPVYPMPAPLPGLCCSDTAPFWVPDLYRFGLGLSETIYQVLYEYKLAGDHLQEPRAIMAVETQSWLTHRGGAMLTLPNGRLLYATGDSLPFGTEGRGPAQDLAEVVSKLLLVDPATGGIEVAAQGVRNVQHLQFVPGAETLVAFADIGGTTAEEVNYVSLASLLDTSFIENFGWGRNPDGLAREGTFYVQPGIAVVANQPAVDSASPSPEAGFIQPQAQYGRNDPNGGFAVSGPVVAPASFSNLSSVFADLSTGVLYGTTASLNATDAPVYKINIVDGDGNVYGTLSEVAGGRADPRMFLFPDGTAGVLFERTGDFYRMTQVQ